MSDEPGFGIETHSTVEPTKDEQIAHLRRRLQEAERKRDEALKRGDDHWADLNLGLENAHARAEAAEAREKVLREALVATADREDAHDGLPCWCLTERTVGKIAHKPYCLAARTALATDPGATE